MSEMLARILIIFLWVLFMNFCVFIRVLFFDRDRIIDSGKYFTVYSILFHVTATIFGIIIGTEIWR